MSDAADVVIVGAGAAGLAAARELSRHGVRCVVLEARDRAGGRIHTLRDVGTPTPIELGAEYMHGEAPITRALAREGQLTVYDVVGDRWRSEHRRLVHFGDFWGRLDRILKLLDEHRSPDRSFAEFLATKPGGRTHARDRALASQWIRGFQAADPNEVSERAMAEGASVAEDEAERTQARIVEGYDSLVQMLASDAPDVRLGAVVSRIRRERGRVAVFLSTSSGTSELDARAAIVTCPLPVLQGSSDEEGHVTFDPRLPDAHERALGGLAMGTVIRVSLVLDEPFWYTKKATKGASLRCLTFLHSGEGGMPVCWTTYPAESPVLVVWYGFPDSVDLARRSRDHIEARTIGDVAKLFHVARRSLEHRVRACYTHNWARDPFSGGAYSYARVGGSAAAKTLSRAIDGTIWLAGEAYDSEGRNGTVEGAIASGQHAARLALRALKGSD